jgi:DNA-binding Lrp family transcriptional regulator
VNDNRFAITELDRIDGELLNTLQATFPLSREPFADIGAGLGLSEDEVIQRIQRLKEERIIRYIGPVLDSRRLGYSNTLVAMRIPEVTIEKAAATVNSHPGVSHNYLRDDDFNLWFTLAVPPDGDMESELNNLTARVKPERVLNLPAVHLFKIGVFFDVSGNGSPAAESSAFNTAPPRGKALSPVEELVINELQQDLPMTSWPFDKMADDVGIQVDEFLETCRRLKESDIIRRFGASLRHQNIGFGANAMVCWKVTPSMIEKTAAVMSGCPEVSHCYERRTAPDWPYNLFTMVHGRTRDEVQKKVLDIAKRTGVEEYKSLFTLKEFKKERMKLKV